MRLKYRVTKRKGGKIKEESDICDRSIKLGRRGTLKCLECNITNYKMNTDLNGNIAEEVEL